MKIELTIVSVDENETPSSLIDKLIKELQVMKPEDRIDGSSAYTRGQVGVSIRRDGFLKGENPYFKHTLCPATINELNKES